jgi:ribosome-binding protein aMBF1 (putative translation factor)
MKKKIPTYDMSWEEYEKVLMKRPGFKEALKETQLEYEIARALIRARIEKKLTQTQLAKKMNTKQSVISRVESGTATPSLTFLKRLAQVLEVPLTVSFG